MSSGLVWFRRDLRLDDNPAFAAATAAHDEVQCLYVLDPDLVDRAGPYRRRQLLADVAALDEELAERGGRLLVRTADRAAGAASGGADHRAPGGSSDRTVDGAAGSSSAGTGDGASTGSAVADAVVATSAGHDGVYWNDDVTPYATARDAAVTEALGDTPIGRWWGHLVLPPGSVCTAAGGVSQVFTPFWRRWAGTDWDRWPEPGEARLADDPGEGPPDPGGEPPMTPGATGATARLADFVERADRYLDDRDRLDRDGTSQLSADLRFGTLSPRHAAQVVGESTKGRAGFVRQLAWRDWWAHLLAERPTLPTAAQREEYDRIEWRHGPGADADFAAWCEGRTGYPVVDAAMRGLRETGWMHNRARMIIGSFLVKDLLIDWRRGERYLRHWLTDGDVAQNAGNWQWVAGTGPDAAPYFRIFNPITQSRRFDPSGSFLRRWLPELARLDDRAIHAPWEVPPLELAEAGVTLGDEYPAPVVDHAEARERTLSAYKAAKGAS